MSTFEEREWIREFTKSLIELEGEMDKRPNIKKHLREIRDKCPLCGAGREDWSGNEPA